MRKACHPRLPLPLAGADIAENHAFASITEAWLAGDHYKWRAMRACGVPERLITGDAADRDKFLAWEKPSRGHRQSAVPLDAPGAETILRTAGYAALGGDGA